MNARIALRASARFSDPAKAKAYLDRVAREPDSMPAVAWVHPVPRKSPGDLLQKSERKAKEMPLERLIRKAQRLASQWRSIQYKVREWVAKGNEPDAFPLKHRSMRIQILLYAVLREAALRGIKVNAPKFFNPEERRLV